MTPDVVQVVPPVTSSPTPKEPSADVSSEAQLSEDRRIGKRSPFAQRSGNVLARRQAGTRALEEKAHRNGPPGRARVLDERQVQKGGRDFRIDQFAWLRRRVAEGEESGSVYGQAGRNRLRVVTQQRV